MNGAARRVARGARRRYRACLLLIPVALFVIAGCSSEEVSVADVDREEDPRVRFWAELRAAQAARGAGDRPVAIAGFERAHELDPDHKDTLYYLGLLRYERGEVALAVEHLSRLAELEPRALRPWQQLSVTRGQPAIGAEIDLDAATEAASRALELNPGESRVHLLLARWAAYRGDRAVALESLRAAIGHNPQLWQGYLLQLWLGVDPEEVRAAIAAQLCGGQAPDSGQCRLRDSLQRALDAQAAGAYPPAARTWDANLRGPERRELEDAGLEALLGLPLVVDSPEAEPYWRSARLADGDDAWIGVARGVPVRVEGVWLQGGEPVDAPLAGAPAPVAGAVLAAADFDADGVDDLFVANVQLESRPGQIGGVLLRGLGAGRFEPTGTEIPGPLTAATAVDLDSDGDVDLLVARLPAAEAAITPPAATEDSRLEPPTVIVWRNQAGRLTPDPAALPALAATVQDIVVSDLDGDGDLDIYLATGTLLPEFVEPDVVWLGQDGGFVDASERLGPGRHGSTLRAWALGGGSIAALRGGLVPGDPRRVLRLRLGVADHGAEGAR